MKTLMAVVIVVILSMGSVFAQGLPSISLNAPQIVIGQEPAPVSDWNWRIDPFIAAGSTLFEGIQTTANLGLTLGTFPVKTPILGGKDFGGMIGRAGGNNCGGPWVQLTGPGSNFLGA